MERAAGLFVATLAAVALTWWWLGRPVEAPAANPGRIQCLSYAPFRGNDSPLDAGTRVEAYEIEDDLAKLARLTDCIRTYSTENGLDQVPAIAQHVGLKVIQGLWLGSDRKKNRVRIDETIALAKSYREVITAIVVGNEVLLRGELSAVDIGDVLREVKAATSMPVTYADVWEYWLRNRDLAQSVDFITVHILPYWEDFPISAAQAGAHVDAIRSRVAASFPGKEILIGEVGWPSAGRMREGALPSPANQALVLEEVMARARAKNYRVNLIEAFDQPWKRKLEGTVGGYWGLLTSGGREPKFAWGEPVSDHPLWRWQMAAGMALAAAAFAGALAGRAKVIRARPPSPAYGGGVGRGPLCQSVPWNCPLPDPPPQAGEGTILTGLGTPVLAGITVDALAAGIAAPWAIANAATESLGAGGWVRGLAFIAVSVAAPVAAAMMLSRGMAIPPFGRVLARAAGRPSSVLALAGGAILLAATVLALQTALGLVFDPRYRDLTFGPMTAAVIPFAVASVVGTKARSRLGRSRPGRAELVSAVTLAASAVYIVLNESFENWQTLWFAAMLVVLAVTLIRLRDVQST
jgi:exo-beta-1,3-glucanase (GH17 family)